LKRKKDEIDRQTRELQEREAELKLAQEEQERKQREHDAEVKKKEDELLAKKQAELRAATEAKEKARMDQVYALGLSFDHSDDHFKGYEAFVPLLDLRFHDDEKWGKLIVGLTAHVATKKEEAEQKRLAEIEEQKELERVRTLGK